jgi:hypothetical protein
MKIKNFGNHTQDMLALACGSCIILIIILIMNRDYPFVGHDYAYFIPHLLDTGLHIRVNGFTIQWYTPSFGGGLPGFPNPQHMEYSIVQLIALFTTPWTAILISTAIISIIGYYLFYKFLNQNLELQWMASALGAMFFIGNGFYIEHLIAGQMGYQLFPLFGAILYILTNKQSYRLYNSVILAVIISMMVHQAGFYLIIILLLSLSITLPILFLYKPQITNLKNLGWITVFTFVLTTAIVSSKIYATIAFMRHFPRDVADIYDVGLFQAMIGVAAQLLGVMNVGPVLTIAQYNPEIITGVLSNLTGAKYGIWETDTGLSPVLIIFLIIGLANIIPYIRRNDWLKFNRSQFFGFIILAIAVWITFELALAKGIIYSSTKQLPILKSLHINVRFVSAFITPLIIIGTFQLHVFFLRHNKLSYFLVSALLTVLSLFSYISLSSEVHISRYDAGLSNILHKDIHNGRILPVTDIEDIDVWRGFAEDASSIKPYEPIFGYKLEEFNPEIHLGSVFEQENGYFNMTNPAGFVFPEINHTHPFERMKLDEHDKLEIFLQRGQPDWKIPTAQKILNIVSLTTIVFSLVMLFLTLVTKSRHST